MAELVRVSPHGLRRGRLAGVLEARTDTDLMPLGARELLVAGRLRCATSLRHARIRPSRLRRRRGRELLLSVVLSHQRHLLTL